MSKPLIYVAGKYSDLSYAAVAANVRAARLYATEVNLTGLAYAVLPHNMSNGIEVSLDDQDWIDCTLELSRRCDGLLLLPSWRHSPGSEGEQKLAILEGRPWAEARSSHAIRDCVTYLVEEIEHRRALVRADFARVAECEVTG